MPRNNRKLAFPHAFSIMTSLRMGKVIDLLRLIASSATFRPSVAEVTRRILAKGMLLEAVEYAWGYESGQRRDVVAELLTATPGLEKVAVAGVPEEDVLWAVLARMWPEASATVDALGMRDRADREVYSMLRPPGPPLTKHGRSRTVEEIREAALADVQAGVKAPKILPPPKTIAEAKQRARQQTEADRLAMAQGVPVAELLARTPGGAGLPVADESAGAQGWASNEGKSPQVRERLAGEAPKTESYGQALKRARGGTS